MLCHYSSSEFLSLNNLLCLKKIMWLLQQKTSHSVFACLISVLKVSYLLKTATVVATTWIIERPLYQIRRFLLKRFDGYVKSRKVIPPIQESRFNWIPWIAWSTVYACSRAKRIVLSTLRWSILILQRHKFNMFIYSNAQLNTNDIYKITRHI